MLTEDGQTNATLAGPGRAPEVLAWLTWSVFAAGLLGLVLTEGRNLPLWDDHFHVSALVGEQAIDSELLWHFNNEHRLPLPRLLHLLTVGLSGDFRAAMLLSVTVLILVSGGLLLALRRITGGLGWEAIAVPILLLHPGHAANVLWAWQIQFIAGTACLLVWLALAGTPVADGLLSRRRAAWLGLLVVALACCGANGLLCTPPLVAWMAWACWSERGRGARSRELVAITALTAVLVLALFVASRPGLQDQRAHMGWIPERAGPMAALLGAWRLVSLGVGPFWEGRVEIVGSAVLLLAAWAVVVGLRARSNADPGARPALLAPLAVIGSVLSLALVLSWARSARELPAFLLPRYVVLVAPLLVAATMSFVQARRLRSARLGGWVLAAFVVACLPHAMTAGFEQARRQSIAQDRILEELYRGHELLEVGRRHHGLLRPRDPEGSAADLARLRDAGLGPLAASESARLAVLERVRRRQAEALGLAYEQVESTGTVQALFVEQREPLLLVQPTGRVRLAVPKGAARLEGTFGQLAQAGAPVGSGATRFSLRSADGRELWAMLLAPASQEAHRAPQALSVELAEGVTELVLLTEAVPPESAAELWPYWSGLGFDP